MEKSAAPSLRSLPSVDELLRSATAKEAIERFGRLSTTAAIRHVLGLVRSGEAAARAVDEIIAAAISQLEEEARPNLKTVFNLTGTVLHTNLGRALLAEAAIEAAAEAMRHAVALEFNLDGAHRGERDDLVRKLLCDLTGAEDATIVNNNAAALLLVLNTLAKGKETIVSRGELIEIGGAFRLPEIMKRAGTKLYEIGTTNRTHLRDYKEALGKKTALILKVHTSNYLIQGFTKDVGAGDLAPVARGHGVPLVNDLGSGTLVDLAHYGFAHEPTVSEAVREGADLVTFSGDKLLGGPQTGFIVGRKDLLSQINRNPLKRALRIDKIRLAALEATLRLYRDPDRLAATLPTLRLLTRTQSDIAALANRLCPVVSAALGEGFIVEVGACESQIGSGSLPLQTIPSSALFIKAKAQKRSGHLVSELSSKLRSLPIPVVGRIDNKALVFDLRCLEDENSFITNLKNLQSLEKIHALD